MAKIAYGIFGEGHGHSSRSRTIIEELRKRHEIHLFAGGNAYQACLKWDLPLTQIPILGFGLDKQGKLNYFRTATSNISRLWQIRKAIHEVHRQIQKNGLDFAISDFEPVVSRAAHRSNVPCVCIDHQHILTNCNTGLKRSLNSTLFQIGCKRWNRHDKYYIITSFFPAPCLPKFSANTLVLPPVLRPEILDVNPRNEDYFLIYQTYNDPATIALKLKDLPYKFRAFPRPQRESIGNVEYYPFSQEAFVESLANCRGIITNGGHTLITEALYLKKPVLSLPVPGQFEQELNGIKVAEMGVGLCQKLEMFSARDFQDFVAGENTFRANIARYNFCGNQEIIQAVEKLIHSHTP